MAEKKKKGFLSKLGFKSKEDKLAAEAAEKAAKQQLVDEQMAARMAAINAAALKSAREQDELKAGVVTDADAQAEIEAEEKLKAEEQAQKDVETAKRLAEEKRQKEEQAIADAKAEEQRLADEKLASEKAQAETKRLADEKAAAEKAAAEAETKRLAEEKVAAEKAAKEQAAADAEAKRLAEEETARIKAEKIKAAKEKAAEDARRIAEEDAALAAARSEKEAQALKARQEAEALQRAKEDAAKRAAEEKAELDRIASEAAEKERQAKEDAARLQREKDQADQAEAKRIAAEEKAAKEKAAQDAAEREAELDREAKRIAEEEEGRARAARLVQEQIEAEEAEAKLQAERLEQERRAAEAAAAVPAAEAAIPKDGFLGRITKGLRKSTSKMSDSMATVFKKRKLDDEAIEELEDLLIASDLGVGPAMKVTQALAKDKFDKQVTDMEIKIALADVISDILTPLEKPLVLGTSKPQIILFVGVNGSGKTTTLGKIAKRHADQGKKILIVAGDTFRAAADAQLKIWGERAGAPVMAGKQGADAAGLVFDAIDRAKKENFDVVMIDTAGRLQNRTELMDELSKIVRVIKKADDTAPHHCILVLDATVGQNALQQTEAFRDTAGVTGLIMTKLDGTAKGGVLVALSDKFKLPIHAIGIGERIEDLENFSAPVFAAALSGVADALVEE